MDSATQARLDDGKRCRDAAQKYRELGISVIPLCPHDHLGVRHINKNHGRNCTSPGKTPLVVWKPYIDRLATEKEIIGWWELCPMANVGAAMGDVSMLVRADVEGAGGLQILQDRSRGDLPDTWSFLSGREGGGGLGLLYRIPEGVQLRTTYEKPAPGEEFRLQARGAQTVLPPSRHVSGRLYEWEAGCSPFEIKPALLPSWAIQMLSVRINAPNGTGKHKRGDDDWQDLYGGVAEGGRHDAALAFAGQLIGAIHDLGNRSGVMAAYAGFAAWNERNDPPLPEEEVRRIFDDIVKKDKERRKREAPDKFSLLMGRQIGPNVFEAPAQNGAFASEENPPPDAPAEPGRNGSASLPLCHLIVWEGGTDNMEYWLRLPFWADLPKMRAQGGYVRLTADEICFWPKIIKAVFIQSDYRLLDRDKEWPKHLNDLMAYAEHRRKPDEAWRVHQVDTFILEEFRLFHPVYLDEAGNEKFGIGEPQQLADGRLVVKLDYLVARGAQRVEKFTRNELIRCLEERAHAVQAQLGTNKNRSRFWVIDPAELDTWREKVVTIAEPERLKK